jgi:hypothetical protein
MLTLLVFILLVTFMEIIFRLLKVPKITHHNIYAKGQALIPKINSNSIVIIGDSKLEWGIKPAEILNNLSNHNINVINMAMPGSNGLDILNYLVEKNISPKLIIAGYAPNYGSYKNHGFDKIKYTAKNKITEQALYYLDQQFYFRDRSVLEFIQHGRPYFKSHEYDSLGGATVNEYGDYASRRNMQFEMYQSFKKNFKETELDNYCAEANRLIAILKHKGTQVCGIEMPVTKKIFALLDTSGNSTRFNTIQYNKAYDFSNFTYGFEEAKPDSAFFYDGCHLEHEYAFIFTKKIFGYIKRDFQGIQ